MNEKRLYKSAVLGKSKHILAVLISAARFLTGLEFLISPTLLTASQEELTFSSKSIRI